MPSSSVVNRDLISVVMPVHNGGRFLAPAIQSILDQTFGHFEFIIIDDASTDDSRNTILGFNDNRIKLVRNEQNLGVTRSLNKAIAHAKGRFIARHDCDDIALPTRLEKQLNYLKNNPDVACVGCNLSIINDEGEVTGVWEYPSSSELVAWKLLFNSAIAHPASMFSLEVFNSVGGYNESIKRAQDYELWSRMSKEHKLANLNETLVLYRIHENAISQSKAEEQINFRRVISSKNIAELSKELSEYDFVSPDTSCKSEFIEFLEKLSALKMAFTTKHNLNNHNVDLINCEFNNMIVNQFLLLGYSEKVKTLFQPKVEAKSLLLPHLIPSSIKRTLKKILNK